MNCRKLSKKVWIIKKGGKYDLELVIWKNENSEKLDPGATITSRYLRTSKNKLHLHNSIG